MYRKTLWDVEQENKLAERKEFLFWKRIVDDSPRLSSIKEAKENQSYKILEYVFKFNIISVFSRADSDTKWDKEAKHYLVTVSLEGNQATYKTFYSQGSGIKEWPRAKSILESLIFDALAGSETFNDFCANFEYDNDSRKAEKIWQACKEVYHFFNSLGLKDNDLYGVEEHIREEEEKELHALYPKEETEEPIEIKE